MQQILDRRLVALGGARLDFIAACAKGCPPHQMRHQSDVFLVCHPGSPSSLSEELLLPPQPTICDLAGSLRDHGFGLEIARTRHPSLEFLGTGGRENAAEPTRCPGINWGTDRVNSSEKFQSGKLPAYAISGCPDARAR